MKHIRENVFIAILDSSNNEIILPIDMSISLSKYILYSNLSNSESKRASTNFEQQRFFFAF